MLHWIKPTLHFTDSGFLVQTLLLLLISRRIRRFFFLLQEKLLAVDGQLNGNRSKQEVGEITKTTVQQRLTTTPMGTVVSTYGPKPLHKESFDIIESQQHEIRLELDKILNEQIPKLIDVLKKA